MKRKLLLGLFVSLLLLAAFGCNNSSDSRVQSTEAIVTLATQGTLPPGTLIGGVSATLNYTTNIGLSVVAGDVVATGEGTGAVFVPNVNTDGEVVIGLISSTGINAGEFATATFAVAVGNFPSATSFGINGGATVVDLNGVDIPGLAVVISSAVLQ